ncbi:MAG TPA: GTPase ObgE [Acidimicrobiia bacterium]|nr:GTPase ObgE [Acidimicrobiia bacterium]
MFVDEVRVHLRSGDGGAGNTAFFKARGRPRGKPLGGSGGQGGDVIVEADASVSTLLDYQRRPHRRAESGTHGKGELQHGRRGEDLILAVPPGTLIRDASGTLLADLAVAGQRITLLTGGRGGLGNAGLAGPRHLAPNFSEQGEYGATADVVFELKVVADAAIIGFPNAGKSTLIARVSAARPKIADYPFTTTVPNLGVVDVDGRRFVLADIPGLVEGAAEGKGLGHVFLRHAERCRALVILLDPSPLQELPCSHQLGILRDELRRHDPALAERPSVVVVGKADLAEAEPAAAALRAAGASPLLVSGVTGLGVEALMHAVADLVGRTDRRGEGEGYILHRPVDVGFAIDRVEGRWIVTGRRAERAVALDDLTKPEAADLAARRLAYAGVDAELRRRGAVPGDEVQIGSIVFEFRDETAEPPDDDTFD